MTILRALHTATIAALLTVAAIAVPARAASGPQVPAGFRASVYAQGLSTPTAMSFGPDGRLYVAQSGGQIVSLGRGGTRAVTSVSGIPLGISWYRRVLYVSSTGEITRLTPSSGYRRFTARVIVSGLPTGRHQNDGMAFRGGWLYVGVGSTCDACAERDPRSATIMRFRLDGSRGQIYARGLRNSYSLAFQPGTGRLYATDNGRDDYGNQVPDELNLIVRGGRYGWPNCWGKSQGIGRNCGSTRPAVALFEAHSSADGMVFYTGKAFPARYRGDAFVAEFGQTVPGGTSGHKVKDVHFAGNRIAVTTFATGFTNPLAVTVAPNGSLLVADYGTGIIWRIAATTR